MFPGHCAKGRSEESILQASSMATQVAVATAAQVGAGAEYETGEKGAGGPSFPVGLGCRFSADCCEENICV